MKIAVILLFVSLTISCAKPDGRASQAQEPAKFFSPQDVCGYPANGSTKAFRRLGGGTWLPISANDPTSGHNCAGGATVVRLFDSGDAAINIEYLATGTERGANIVTMEYSATNTSAIDNESTYRNVFANLANDILRQALQEPMTELMRKKILNLASYFKPGKVDDETFFVGDGFVNLAREHDQSNSSIKITLRIYPDKSLKLDDGR